MDNIELEEADHMVKPKMDEREDWPRQSVFSKICQQC